MLVWSESFVLNLLGKIGQDENVYTQKNNWVQTRCSDPEQMFKSKTYVWFHCVECVVVVIKCELCDHLDAFGFLLLWTSSVNPKWKHQRTPEKAVHPCLIKIKWWWIFSRQLNSKDAAFVCFLGPCFCPNPADPFNIHDLVPGEANRTGLVRCAGFLLCVMETGECAGCCLNQTAAAL